jgi:hypothetical protein
VVVGVVVHGGIVVVPLADNAILWAGLGVAGNSLSQVWALFATIQRFSDDPTVLQALAAAACCRASAMEVSSAAVCTMAREGTQVVIVRVVISPLAHLAVDWASLGVAWNIAAKIGASQAAECGVVNNATVLATNTSTAGHGALSQPVHIGITNVVSPLGDDAVLWAGLGVAGNNLSQRWASSTAVLSNSDDVAVLSLVASLKVVVRVNVAASLAASADRPVRAWVTCVDSVGTGGHWVGVGWVVRPLRHDAVTWATLDVALDCLGQCGARSAAECGWDQDVAVESLNAASASHRARCRFEVNGVGALLADGLVCGPLRHDTVHGAVLRVARNVASQVGKSVLEASA